jgi:predicted transcriptional regulator
MHVRKSKLEYYQEILETLVMKSLTVDNLAYETGTDCTVLQQRLDFLIIQGLVKEQVLGERTLCVITERGVTVLRALNLQKRLEKVKATLTSTNEGSQITPTIAENKNKKA